MTQQEIEELAGHRKVSAWVIKLVADALNKETEKHIDLLMRLHERSAGSHNYYHFAANQIAEMSRVHLSSGKCWCKPELNYKDPETGAEVWIHRGLQ